MEELGTPFWAPLIFGIAALVVGIRLWRIGDRKPQKTWPQGMPDRRLELVTAARLACRARQERRRGLLLWAPDGASRRMCRTVCGKCRRIAEHAVRTIEVEGFIDEP